MRKINSLLLKLCMVGVLFIASTQVKAQSYTLTTLNQTYTNLSGASLLPYFDEWTSMSFSSYLPYGYNFPYFDSIHTNLTVLAGELSLGYGVEYIVAFSNLALCSEGSGLSPVSYLISGTVGNRILKIEWKNARISETSEYINVQAWLYENGTIEFHYGSNTISASTMTTTYIGLYHDMDILYLVGSPTAPTFMDPYDPDCLSSAPTNGTVYRFTKNASGIKNTLAENVSIYPNPTTGEVTVNAPTVSGIEVYNLLGEKVLNSSETTIDLSAQPDGVYLVKVQAGDAVYTEKVLKK